VAADVPIGQVSVAEICRRAGVTRDTFYRHAETPVALLAEALGEELSEILAEVGGLDSLTSAEELLLTHVRDRRDLYRGALEPSLAAPLRANLERAIAAGLEDWLRRHPGIEPVAVADGAGHDIAVAYAAGGTVAAIEVWLRSGAEDVAQAAGAILAASPQWWLR